jgi:transcription antitermination factor NusG
MKRWFAVRTRPACETKTADEITRRHELPVFLPQAFEMVRHGRWLEPEPSGLLFPRYVFVIVRLPPRRKISGEWRQTFPVSAMPIWGELRELRGVERIMGNVRDGIFAPVSIPYSEMRRIRSYSQHGPRKRIATAFKKNDIARIKDGPFSGFDVLVEGSKNQRVKALLRLFGQDTEIELDESQLETAPAA